MTSRLARLHPRWGHLYPNLNPATAYRVLEREPEGFWIEAPGLGDPFLSPNRLFVFHGHFDVSEGPD